jgi:hypothetical protein
MKEKLEDLIVEDRLGEVCRMARLIYKMDQPMIDWIILVTDGKYGVEEIKEKLESLNNKEEEK